MQIGEYIKTLRQGKGLSQEELGKVVGVQRAAVQKWEAGTVKNLKRETIKKLADYFEVEPASFIIEDIAFSEKTSASENKKQEFQKYDIRPIQTKKFPLLGEIACGEPIYCNESYETYVEASSNINADFCLTAKGDSMINARIFDGDIVFIREQPTVKNGEIAAVIIDDTATLKRVYLKNDRIILRPENPTYDDIVYEKEDLNNVRILGKAVAFQSLVR